MIFGGLNAATRVARTSEVLGSPRNPASRCIAGVFARLNTGVDHTGRPWFVTGAPETSLAALQNCTKMIDLIALNY